MPKTNDFQKAARITIMLWTKLQKEMESSVNAILLKSNRTTLERRLTPESQYNAIYKRVTKRHKTKITQSASTLIPKTREKLEKVMLDTKEHGNMDVARSIAKHMGTHRRSVDWIIKNGMCIENLVPRKSTIKQAGQGAFAQWTLRKGDIVVPAPLLHILDRDVLDMYNEDGDKIGKQLLLNYCFGHHDTSLLVCPDTNAILINHCSSRQERCGPQGPNAKVQWSSGWDKDSDRWLGMSIDDISKQAGRGLAMEIVATRDIQPGEEVREV